MDGVARCSRYSFGPNRLHLCGPDVNRDVLEYINENASDEGLAGILRKFRTLYPYLRQIAAANNIKDPFDDRVVEAYWLGNELLDAVSAKTYFRHLNDNTNIMKRLTFRAADGLKQKLREGAPAHHSFHVLNIWSMRGQREEQSARTLDKCCVTCGRVLKVSGPIITVRRNPLTENGGRLCFGPAKTQKIIRHLEHGSLLDNVKKSDFISIHWDTPCEIITAAQAANLREYTRLSLRLANQLPAPRTFGSLRENNAPHSKIKLPSI